MIGARLPVKAVQLTGRALGSRILQTAILRGSIDYAADPDQEIVITPELSIDIGLDKQALITTAAVSGSIFTASTLFFVKRIRYANRLFAAANMMRDIAASLDYMRTSFETMNSLVTDLDAGVLRGNTLENAVKFQVAQINGELDKMDVLIQLVDALNDPTVSKQEVKNIATRLNILSDFGRTMSQNVMEAYQLIDDTNLDRDLQRQFRMIFGDDALGLKLTVDDLRQQTRDLNNILRVQISPAIEATQMQLDDLRAAVLSGNLDVLKIRPVDRQLANAVEDAYIMAGTALEQADDLATAGKIADNLAGGKTKTAKVFKFAGRAVGKILLFDTVIWGVTAGIDLGLNLFLTEEDQGFFANYVGGFSPVGEGLTWIFQKTWDFFVPPETAETIGQVLLSTMILAANSDDVEGVLATVLDFFVEEVSPDIDVNLDFAVEQQIEVSPFGWVQGFDPEDILIGFYIAIVAKLVYTYWLAPAWRSLADNYL